MSGAEPVPEDFGQVFKSDNIWCLYTAGLRASNQQNKLSKNKTKKIFLDSSKENVSAWYYLPPKTVPVCTCCSLNPSPLKNVFPKILTLSACNMGNLSDQLNQAKCLTCWGTVWEVKWCVKGENGPILQGEGPKLQHIYQQVTFFFFLVR